MGTLQTKTGLPGLPGKWTKTSLTLPRSLNFSDWNVIGQKISECEQAVMWWMGDWWAFGESAYGERASQALESDYAFQTWADAGWVARKIETSRRREVVSWSIHKEVAALPPKAQNQLLSKAEKEGWTRRDMRRAVRRYKAGERDKVEFPKGKYRIIYADPPWEYGNEMPKGTTTPADYYPLMPLDDICALPVEDLSLENAVLFLWTTSPLLEDSFKVVNEWGFSYKTTFIWDKVKHNMGHYNSVRHEILLVCVKGSCPPDEQKLFDSVQSIERNGHSEKPENFRTIIDTIYCSGPRIELFGRREVPPHWDVWGNE